MRPIQSRKHAAARQPRHRSTVALAAALALPGTVLAQSAVAPAAGASQARGEATLPAVKVQAAAPENDYKADAVSSPKFTQPLVDTPQTITVIKKELLKQQAATSLSEALRNTPGVTMQLGENGSTQTGDSINLRGFDSSQSIFVDGIRDLGAVSRDMFNIDQVEVVKGPSGSDIGRGASSAYVNLVSRTAQADGAFATGSLLAGTADRKRLEADFNTPLASLPGSAVRLDVMAQDQGVPGRDEVRQKRWGVAPTATFGLGSSTRETLSILHVQQDNRPDGGVSTFGLKGYVFAAATATAPAQKPGPSVDPGNFYGLAGDFDRVKTDMITSKLESDLAKGVVLRNTTRIGRTVQDVVVTGVNAVTATADLPSGYTVARSRQGRHQDNEILTNQTNLAAGFEAFGLKNALSSGVEMSYERQRTATPVTVAGTASLYAPDPGDVMAQPSYKGTQATGSTLTASAYAFETLDVTNALLFNAGARVDRFHTDTSSATYTAASGATPASLVNNAPLGLTGTLWSWKVGAVFKPANNGSVYVTYSDSRNPPGGSNFALSSQANSAAQPGLKPQEGTNVEFGTKWDLLGGNLLATAAVYRSENRNELVSDGATVPTYAQVGKRRVQGIELGLVGNVTKDLGVSLGWSTMDSRIVRGAPTQQGGVIVFSPKNTFTSWATLKLPLGVTLGGGMRHADASARSSNTAAPTSNLLEAPAYWVGDAMASYEVSKNWQVQLNVYNVFDRRYIQSLNNGGSRYTPGAERNALVSLNARF
ncbi:MAG: catecholate siderophore receptor Fiu [Burkholderiaceae bacterium]